MLSADMLFGAFAPIAVFMPTVTTMAANGEGGLLPLGVFTGSTMLAMSFCEPSNSSTRNSRRCFQGFRASEPAV